ncbi:gamma-butyrobetaine hydroxylase-like domain-containing protein [Agaribacterium sp. ZY112]|uniref:gamma-butyrobetaine hydroxylase-like domain-containing protein n=1 Tax=Agaribacterium sp. ZY112 TaxID=3233574 RepID=UPI00352476FE
MKPTKLTLHSKRAELELSYGAESYCLSAELLRVLSPSAEVQGHGPGQKKVPLDKHEVNISDIERQGNYALRLIFDDGHDSGIYSWAYLRKLCLEQEPLWRDYLVEAEERRQELSGVQVIKFQP